MVKYANALYGYANKQGGFTMKKFIIIAVLVLMAAGTAYAFQECRTDFTCMSNCQAKGYQYGYCKSICSWCTEW